MKKQRVSYIQIFRYGVVGFAANLIGYMLYLLITYFGGTPKLTMSVLYGVSLTFSFWLNKKSTFFYRGCTLVAVGRYIFVHIIGYFINLSVLIVMVDSMGFAHQGAQAIAIIIVAFFLFFALKFFVFRESN